MRLTTGMPASMNPATSQNRKRLARRSSAVASSDYGVGAFLLAGHEVSILAPPYEEIHRSYLPFIATP